MNRLQAIQSIIANVADDDIIIHVNGAISRESFYCQDRPANFYLLGSMGLAASVGLGIALSSPEKKIIILDGDGNLLMGFGNLAIIGALKVPNLLHLVLDNGVYGTTGNQPTISNRISFPDIAKACGYRQAISITSSEDLKKIIIEYRQTQGPAIIHIPVSVEVTLTTGRLPYPAQQIKERFMSAIKS